MKPALHERSAADLTAAFRRRELSPLDATRAALARIAEMEPKLNAMYRVDREGAIEQARAAEARWEDGRPLSRLDGVPLTIKENIHTRGVPAPIGTRANEDAPLQAADAPPAARVREAGCVILGKTTMPDFGMLSSGLSSIHGLTRNPWNTTRNTSGSSSGAGAAAAAGYAPLHLGTDIGGSVRLPATHCGIFALKPSLGRVPIHPPYIGRVAGPMTRTVEDAALMMNILARPDARDYMSLPAEDRDFSADLERLDPRQLKVGLLPDMGVGLTIDREVRAAAEAAARRARVLPFVAEWCSWRAARFSGRDVMQAYTLVMALREAAVAASQPYDFILSPTSPILPYEAELPCPGNDPHNALPHIAFTVPFNMSEQPAASVNWNFSANGLPIGVQLVGARFDDAGVLQLARAIERLRPAQKPWPE